MCLLVTTLLCSIFSLALAGPAGFDLNDDLSLDLSLHSNMDTAPSSKVLDSQLVKQALADDISNDFKATEFALAELEKHIHQLYGRLQMGEGGLLQAKLVQLGGTKEMLSSFGAQLIEELDLIANTYFPTFKQQLVGIITDRPQNLQPKDMAYRCTRINDINNLRKLGWSSQLYQLILDVFFSELYAHCLTRRLVLLEVNQVNPSSLVRQFVDIYLDLPPSASLKASPVSIDRILGGASVNFNLPEALRKHGPLQSVSQYVIDPKASLGMGLDSAHSNSADLVQRFKVECRHYLEQLQVHWTDFDQIAHKFTTPMNNLMQWNDQVKLLIPGLVYGSICNQLASAT